MYDKINKSESSQKYGDGTKEIKFWPPTRKISNYTTLKFRGLAYSFFLKYIL